MIAKEHFLENEELRVKKYYPQLEGQVINELLCEIPLSSKKKAEVEGELSKPVNLVKPAILPGRQTISVDVDHDIMEFTTNGTYFKELENKLCDLKAEVEWDFGSDIATIRKKANSGYVKKWASSCQAVMVEYLDRFEKFFVPLDEKVEATVSATLPRLAETVSSKKATWKQVETEQKLMVVCSKDDLENVTQSVKEFMETIKKEEIRKSYKKETIRGINQYRLQLLKQSRFAKKMEDKHAELDVKLDLEKQELSFEGPREQFTDAKIRYLHTMNEISEETLVLSPHNVVDILASEEGKSYIQEKLAREKIAAIFLTEDGNVIRIFAENSRELGRARDCIRNSMSKAQIPFPEGHTFAFIKEKWKQISERLKSHRLIDLSINYSTSSIALYGAADIVEESKVSITEYLASQTIQERKRVVSHGVARFLSQNLSSKVKNIELELKDDQASIEVNKTQNVIWFKATKSGLDKCERSVVELCQMVSVKRNELSSPGLSRLLSSETGQRYMKLIEIEKNLIIEVTREQRKGAIVDTSKIEVESIRKELEREREKKISLEENRRKSVINTKSVESTYDLCNFSTKEGIRVSWKYGNIANETVSTQEN